MVTLDSTLSSPLFLGMGDIDDNSTHGTYVLGPCYATRLNRNYLVYLSNSKTMENVNTHNIESFDYDRTYLGKLLSDDIDNNELNGEQQCKTQPPHIHYVNNDHVDMTQSFAKVDQHNRYHQFNPSDIAILFDLVKPDNVLDTTYQHQFINADCIRPSSPQTHLSIPSYIEPTSSFTAGGHHQQHQYEHNHRGDTTFNTPCTTSLFDLVNVYNVWEALQTQSINYKCIDPPQSCGPSSSDAQHYCLPQAINYDYITAAQSAYGYDQQRHYRSTRPFAQHPYIYQQLSNNKDDITYNDYYPMNAYVNQQLYPTTITAELFNQSSSTNVTHERNSDTQKLEYISDLVTEDNSVCSKGDVDTIECQISPPTTPPINSSSNMRSLDQSGYFQPELTDNPVSVLLLFYQTCIYVKS